MPTYWIEWIGFDGKPYSGHETRDYPTVKSHADRIRAGFGLGSDLARSVKIRSVRPNCGIY